MCVLLFVVCWCCLSLFVVRCLLRGDACCLLSLFVTVRRRVLFVIVRCSLCVVVCRSLFVVRCLLVVECWFVSVVCYLLFVVVCCCVCLLFVVSCLLDDGHCWCSLLVAACG